MEKRPAIVPEKGADVAFVKSQGYDIIYNVPCKIPNKLPPNTLNVCENIIDKNINIIFDKFKEKRFKFVIEKIITINEKTGNINFDLLDSERNPIRRTYDIADDINDSNKHSINERNDNPYAILNANPVIKIGKNVTNEEFLGDLIFPKINFIAQIDTKDEIYRILIPIFGALKYPRDDPITAEIKLNPEEDATNDAPKG